MPNQNKKISFWHKIAFYLTNIFGPEQRLIHFADGNPGEGGGGNQGGNPPNPPHPATPEVTPDGQPIPPEFKEAVEELNYLRDNNLINDRTYANRLKGLRRDFGLSEGAASTAAPGAPEARSEGQPTPEIPAGTSPPTAVDQQRAAQRQQVEDVLQGNYREYGIDNMDKLKSEFEGLNKRDQELQKEIQDIIKLLEIPPQERKGVLDPERLDFEGKNFTFLRSKYERAEGKTESELQAELAELQSKTKTQESLARIKKIENILLKQIQTKKSAFDSLYELKKEEAEIEKAFQENLDKMKRMSGIMNRKLEQAAIKGNILKTADGMTGIHIAEGTHLKFKDIALNENGDEIQGAIEREFIIKKIHFKKSKISQRRAKREVNRELGDMEIELQEVSPGGKAQGAMKSGAYEWKRYTLNNFTRFIQQNDVVEVIDSLEELNKNLGWGSDLKVGSKLEYNILRSDERGKILKVPETVTIQDIRDGKIILDKEVSIPIPNIETGERKYKEPTFGEFAKWYRNREAEEQIADLQSLQDKLKRLNDYLNQTLKRDPAKYPPITLAKGEALQQPWGQDEHYFIEDVTPEGKVKIQGDGDLTPTQFYKWVKDNGIAKFDPLIEAENEIEMLGPESVQEANVEDAIKKAKENYEKHLEEEKKRAAEKGVDLEAQGLNIFGWDNQDAVWNKWTLWTDMRLLSMNDFIQMGKTIWEFVVRRYQRRSKGAYGMIGEALPGKLGTEFKKIRQGAENEEVQQYQDAFKALGIWEIKDILYDTKNRDEAKACFIILSEKGEIRWDDANIWDALTRITAGKYPVKNEDGCKPAIDFLWGDGQWHDWFSKNISSYNNNKNNWEYKGKQLENDPKLTGGLAAEMKRLLNDWKTGKYVNPMEYEELIDFAIKYGKMTAEQKMFYLLSGIITKSPKGYGTLMHMDRLGDIDGKYLNQFPMLDYFTQINFRDLDIDQAISEGRAKNKNEAMEKGIVKERRLRLDDFEYYKNKYFQEEYQNSAPGINFTKFMWQVMITDKNTRTRLSKGLRSAENMDHDDAHMFIPPGTPEEIRQLTTAASGNKKYFTPEGYSNAFSGFSQYIMTLARNAIDNTGSEQGRQDRSELAIALASATTFDVITANRYLKAQGDRYQRLGEHHFERRSVVDSAKTKYHRSQLRNLIKDVLIEYGRAYPDQFGKTLVDINYLFDYTIRPGEDDLNNTKQKMLEQKIASYIDQRIPQMVNIDGGELLLQVVCRHTQQPQLDADGNPNVNALRGVGDFFPPAERVINYNPPANPGGPKRPSPRPPSNVTPLPKQASPRLPRTLTTPEEEETELGLPWSGT